MRLCSDVYIGTFTRIELLVRFDQEVTAQDRSVWIINWEEAPVGGGRMESSTRDTVSM